MIIVDHVTEQSVGSYEVMHGYKYVMCVYVNLIPRSQLVCFHLMCFVHT